MKRLLLLFALFHYGLLPHSSAQCGSPQLGILITNQEDVDSFAIRYPNCTQIMGNLTIAGKTHLGEPFPGAPITNLQGLSQIQVVSFDLRIRHCDSLVDLRGLEGLVEIQRELHLQDNSGLTSLEGLNNLRSVEDVLVERPRFTDFTGLDNLTQIGRSLQVEELYFNPFSFKGLERLESIGQDLFIDKASRLTSMEGLEKLETIGQHLFIQSARDLSYLGMDRLYFIGGDFFINLVDSLRDFTNMSRLNNIGGDFTINAVDALERFDGLEGLERIGGHFRFDDNIRGETARGLANLWSVSGDLELDMQMDSTGGLEKLLYVGGDCYITGQFPEGSAAFGLLANVGGDLIIDLNDHPLSQLYPMPNLETVGKSLNIIRSSSLTDLQGLNNLSHIGEDLSLKWVTSINDLSGLDSLKEVSEIEIFRGYSLQNLKGIDALRSVSRLKVESCAQLKSLDGLDSLSSISVIELIENDSLNNISGISNVHPNSMNFLRIARNPLLAMCNELNICNYLDSGGASDIQKNATGCTDTSEINNACEDFLRLYYKLYYDINQNKVQDSLEPYLSGACITIDPIDYKVFQQPDDLGRLFLMDGDYSVYYDTSCTPLWALTTDSTHYQVSLDFVSPSDTVQFGLYPRTKASDVITSVHVPTVRCGTSGAFEVHAHNLGTTTAEGTLWLKLAANIELDSFLDPVDTMVGADLFGWHFSTLFPEQTTSRKIKLKVPIEVGSAIELIAHVMYDDENGPHLSEPFETENIILCAYDPNDKLVTPNRDNNYTLYEEALFYTIRFQNTGNAEAYDVVIRDTLDPNLDYTTFRILSTSHPEQLQTLLEDDRHINFEFKNIFLPDSTSDFEGSQGYVSYRIQPIAGLPEQTVIQNSASIYFDFNPPIRTNVTENILVSELVSTAREPSAGAINISISPNPASGEVQVKSSDLRAAQLKMTDLSGRLILKKPFDGELTLDMQDLPNGVYFISLHSANAISTYKLLKLSP